MSFIIRTNNVPRHVVYGYELTAKERAEFDYLSEDELMERSFVRYRGWTYDLGDVESVRSAHFPVDHPLERYHGFVSDSFFSGVAFRYSGSDFESVVCATYIVTSTND
jgi:hypothetical protein